MTKPYSDDLRERVVAAMQSGASCRSVAAKFGVAPSSVVKWTQRAARTGSVNLLDQPEQEVSGNGGGGFLMQLDEGELRGAVDGHEHMQLALFGAHLGDVDVEVADRVGFELLPRRLVALDIRQAADAVALQAAMQ